MRKLIVGTRRSKLAQWQTQRTILALKAVSPDLIFETISLMTEGDRTQANNQPLPEIGGKGLFTQALESALRERKIDLAVHSLKDLPTDQAEGVTIGAIFDRREVRDMYLSHKYSYKELPQGSVVGTSSVRRTAQLLAFRPDLIIRAIRGNIDTRILKMESGEYDAIILAGAGVERLGVQVKYQEYLPLELMLPAPGQGALAVQCRNDDEFTLNILRTINNEQSANETAIEREFLSILNGGCSAPVAAYATHQNSSIFKLDALVAHPKGKKLIRVQREGSSVSLAQECADDVKKNGADEILLEVAHQRNVRPLMGKHIAITRPLAQSDDLRDRLVALGGDVSVAPTIAIKERTLGAKEVAIFHQLSAYDWVIFTSSNAIEIFMNMLAREAVSFPKTLKVAAVGPSTRATLESRGIIANSVPKDWSSTHIPAVLGDIHGNHILIPQAQNGKSELRDKLITEGAKVDTIHLYETVKEPLTKEMIYTICNKTDVIIFMSGSAAESLINQSHASTELEQALSRLLFVCIGESTASVLREYGYNKIIVGTSNSIDGIIESLVMHFQ